MSQILEKAEVAEDIFHQSMDKPFEIERALLFSVNEGDDGQMSITLANANGDVYDLLDNDDTLLVAKVSDYIAIVTTGWASPIGDNGEVDTPPSQHPQRRRVRLMVMASRDQMASVLRFQDEPDEKVTDDGHAHGSLADALMQVMARAKA
jgi:hypothetical protein